MKVKALDVFRSKLCKPCRKLLLIFRLRLKKPVLIRALPFRAHKSKSQKAFTTKPMSSLLSIFRSPKKSKSMDRLQDLRSPSNVHETSIFPSPDSPLTPAYVRARRAEKKEASLQEVEDTCRSFENYLVEMIMEEGKTMDLMDVEELLHCWKNLKCPVFIDLVCRFYGELCRDLFSSDSEEGHCSN